MIKLNFSLNKKRSYFLKLITFYLLFFSSITTVMAESPEKYIQMIELSTPFRKVAEEFIYLAQKSDKSALKELITVGVKKQSGDTVLEEFLSTKIIPFFKESKSIDKSFTTTYTTDSFGNKGFAFYMYLPPKAPNVSRSPFVIYVVKENGRFAIANVLVNSFVKNRHLP